MKIEVRIVRDIIEDLSDRRGLRQEWEHIDPEIQGQIRRTWRAIVRLACDGVKGERGLATTVRVMRVNPESGVEVPKYMTAGAAGFDLRAAADAEVWPGQTVMVGTGLAFEIPNWLEMQIRPRSGISKLGVQSFLGTIDSDYRGEVGILLHNSGPERFLVRKGDRIAQGVISPVVRVLFEMADELSRTERGAGGFGHTGVK
jgi:dUTP pyrophosphatase